MALVDDVTAQMKDAMKAKAKERVAALRIIRAAFLTEMKKTGDDTLSDDVATGVLRRLEKQRKESIDAFRKAGRDDRVAAEEAELAVVQTFLPSLADEATTRAWVEAAIAESGAATRKEAGKVMGALMKSHKGEVDGGLAQRIAQELLADA